MHAATNNMAYYTTVTSNNRHMQQVA